MPSERDKTRLRWFQFRICELLIGMLAIALALGWWIDREQLCREVEIQKVLGKVQSIQLKQAAEAQVRWEVKYKNFRITIDELLQLEHFGRSLDDYGPDELAVLKKEIDKRYATIPDDEPTAAHIKKRIEFLRKLHELKEGVTIDLPARMDGGPGSGRDVKTPQ